MDTLIFIINNEPCEDDAVVDGAVAKVFAPCRVGDLDHEFISALVESGLGLNRLRVLAAVRNFGLR